MESQADKRWMEERTVEEGGEDRRGEQLASLETRFSLEVSRHSEKRKKRKHHRVVTSQYMSTLYSKDCTAFQPCTSVGDTETVVETAHFYI